MHAINLSTLTMLASLFASTLANPLEARDATANVRVFSGDSCDGASSSFSLVGSGLTRCVPVSQGRRSISVTGRYAE